MGKIRSFFKAAALLANPQAFKMTYHLAQLHMSDWFRGIKGMGNMSFLALWKRAYKNPYAGRGLRLIAQTMAEVPIVVKRNGEVVEDDVSRAMLDLLSRPNARTSRGKFFQMLVDHLYCAGELFIEARTPETGRNAGRPLELHLHEPSRFTSFAEDGMGEIVGYHVSGRRGRGSKTYDMDAMHMATVYNAEDPDRGVALLLSGGRALNASEKNDEWNIALATNGGRIPTYFVPTNLPAGKKLSPEQRQSAQDNIDDVWGDQSKKNKPLVLNGAFDVMEANVKPKDADFLETGRDNARKIAAVIGFDPALIGDAANRTYSNLKEARKALYILTVLPLLQYVLDELNLWLAPKFGKDLKLCYDAEQIEALQEDMTDKVKRYVIATGRPILTVDEARIALSYKELRGDAAILYQPGQRTDRLPEPGETATIRHLRALTSHAA